jgi:hypothetical protein
MFLIKISTVKMTWYSKSVEIPFVYIFSKLSEALWFLRKNMWTIILGALEYGGKLAVPTNDERWRRAITAQWLIGGQIIVLFRQVTMLVYLFFYACAETMMISRITSYYCWSAQARKGDCSAFLPWEIKL